MSVAVSPDSNFVATGSKDKSVKLCEYNTGGEVRNYFLSVQSRLFSHSVGWGYKILDLLSNKEFSNTLKQLLSWMLVSPTGL